MNRLPSRNLSASDHDGMTGIFNDVGEMMTGAAAVIDSAARAGVSFGVAAALGAAVYDSALGLPVSDVLAPHSISLILTFVSIGLGAGVIRSLHLARVGVGVVSASGTIGPDPVETRPATPELD